MILLPTLSLGALLIFTTSLLAGLYPFLKPSLESSAFIRGEAFACGVFLGVGLVDILGDAASGFTALGLNPHLAFLITGSFFLALLLLEHIHREMKQSPDHTEPPFVLLTLLMLSIHSLLEGAALGLSRSFSMALIILIAIISHKWAASFALAVQLRKGIQSKTWGGVWFVLFAAMTPIGILFGTSVANHANFYPPLNPIVNSLAAGTFLYLGTLHGLKRSVLVHQCCSLKQFMFVILGFLVMSAVSFWV
ncbi:MAG: zinc transporter [Gammaproteobacteria bacterium]|nr:zinc transporter [Gammaproteobacteria bacterium]